MATKILRGLNFNYMKIGLLTVPFNNNYGGFLQAFALKTYLEAKGHRVTIINRRRDYERKGLVKKIKTDIKRIIKFILGYRTTDLSLYTKKFVDEYLSPITKKIYTINGLKKFADFDFYIVGSDQVWRYKYATTSIANYYFDFLKGTNKPRISYAASFGVSYNEYDKENIEKCSVLLKEFKALSVRESSGIKLLTDIFSVKSDIYHVLDPTMLIDKNIYVELAKKYSESNDNHYICTYVLDKTEDKRNLIDKISKEKNLQVMNIDAQTENNKSVIEPVEKWLSCILNSSYVVTDSFHGMVFSIIFNKPFTVYINKDRGVERFKSLLSLLNIESCMIDNSISYKSLNFDWDSINNLLNTYRKKSEDFLDKSIEMN